MSSCYTRGIGVEANRTLSLHYAAMSQRLGEEEMERGGEKLEPRVQKKAWEGVEDQEVHGKEESRRDGDGIDENFTFDSCWGGSEIEDSGFEAFNEVDRDVLMLPVHRYDLERRGLGQQRDEFTKRLFPKNPGDNYGDDSEGGGVSWEGGEPSHAVDG